MARPRWTSTRCWRRCAARRPPRTSARACGSAICTCTWATSTRALAFYRDVLGFELQANLGSAAFVSAGGYHHHLGVNVWNGRGVGPAPEHTAGLHHWTVQLPTTAEVDAVRTRVEAAGLDVEDADRGFVVRDPWDIALHFTTT